LQKNHFDAHDNLNVTGMKKKFNTANTRSFDLYNHNKGYLFKGEGIIGLRKKEKEELHIFVSTNICNLFYFRSFTSPDVKIGGGDK